MKRLFFIIYTIMACQLMSLAANVDSALVEHASMTRLPSLEAMRNPALHGTGCQMSFSQLAVGIDCNRQSTAFVPEQGTGDILPYIKINTFHRLNDRSSVWGEASYATGKRHDIQWNSTSDYDLLQPYVLADTLGGDTRLERYAIQGGYSLSVNRWSVGGEVLVRAQQEYRRRDPRMRGVVTDLTLRLGGGYEIGKYQIGATIEGNIYKQTNSVAFYREEGVIPEYQMTGLGTEYSRFSGDKRSLYFDGGGVALLLHASAVDHCGPYADVALDQHRYHRKLAEFNSMPLTDLYNEHVGATVGWERGGKTRLAVFGHVDYTRRIGNEHVGGKSDARYFPVIACLTMYKRHQLNGSVGALLGKDNRHAVLTVGYSSIGEEYVYPHRQMDAGHVYAKLFGQAFFKPSRKLLLTLDAHAAYYARVSDKFVMPLANMEAPVIRLVQHKHDYARANYAVFGAKARADYGLKGTRIGLFAELGAGATLCSVGEHEWRLQSSIGITF